MKEVRKYKSAEEESPVISKVSEIDMSSTYSYANYLKWQFDERLELIKGKVFEMSPAPSVSHQRVLLRLAIIFEKVLKYKSCETFIAPFDVRFPDQSKADQEIYTVVQPDICIVCDSGKLDEKGCLGAPDLIVEILSPGNNRKELLVKYELYQEFGVKEYLIVDPKRKVFTKYMLNEDGRYQQRIFRSTEAYTSVFLPGASVSPEEIFGPSSSNFHIMDKDL